jgi:hypothetical protein
MVERWEVREIKRGKKLSSLFIALDLNFEIIVVRTAFGFEILI